MDMNISKGWLGQCLTGSKSALLAVVEASNTRVLVELKIGENNDCYYENWSQRQLERTFLDICILAVKFMEILLTFIE